MRQNACKHFVPGHPVRSGRIKIQEEKSGSLVLAHNHYTMLPLSSAQMAGSKCSLNGKYRRDREQPPRMEIGFAQGHPAYQQKGWNRNSYL